MSETLPVPVLLGRDIPQLSQLLGKPLTTCPELEDVMVVVTRAQAKKEVQEEIEKETLAGVVAKPMVESQVEPENIEKGLESVPQKVTKKVRRLLCQDMGKQKSEHSVNPVLQMSADSLRGLQETDPSLSQVRAAVNKGDKSTAQFYKKEGLFFYRRWTPKCQGGGKGSQVEHLVLPSCCRRTVLELGHQIPLSGHLGKEKTLKRILRQFFWPSIFKDMEDFCRSYIQCQKSSGHKVPPAPLIPLPVISEPFSRIAMDIIGPLP